MADAIVSTIRAGVGLGDFREGDANELVQFAVRRGLLGSEEGEQLLAEVKDACKKARAKARAKKTKKRATATAKPSGASRRRRRSRPAGQRWPGRPPPRRPRPASPGQERRRRSVRLAVRGLAPVAAVQRGSTRSPERRFLRSTRSALASMPRLLHSTPLVIAQCRTRLAAAP